MPISSGAQRLGVVDSPLALFGDPGLVLFNSGADFCHSVEQPGQGPGYVGRHRMELDQL